MAAIGLRHQMSMERILRGWNNKNKTRYIKMRVKKHPLKYCPKRGCTRLRSDVNKSLGRGDLGDAPGGT